MPVALLRSVRVHSRLLLALQCAGALCATAAHAQDNAPAPTANTLDQVLVTGRTEGYQVRGTNTATKLPLTLRETPQSLTVFTRQRIEDFNLITIAEVLQQTPGVTVQSYDSNRTLFTARGFAINNFMFDGVPTNYTTGAGGNSILSDTSIYERIEVVRGASGLVTGSGNPSATVNMVRKRPTTAFQASTSLNVGSWDYRRAELDVAGPLTSGGRVRGRVVGAYTEKDSWVRFQQDRSPSVYGVLEADLTDSTRLRVGIDHLATHSDGGAWSAAPLLFSDGTPARLPRSYSAAARWNRWERESTNVFATLEQQFAGGWSGRLAYNHRATDTDSLLFAGSNSASFADARTGLGLRVSDTYGVSETRENALDLYASGPFQWLGRAHELVVGANHYDRDLGTLRTAITARPYSLTAFPSIFDWNGDVGRPTTTNAGIPSSITNTQETGYYAAVRLNPTDALKLIGGARHSSWNTATDNYSPANQFTGRSADYDANALTPYLGAIYDLSRHLSAFVSYSDVFQAQNLRDRANQQLDPVVGANLEYGFKGEFFGGALYAALNGFHMQQDNVAEIDPEIAPNSLPDGSSAYRAVSGVETWGGEFEVSGAITPDWSMTGGYTYAYSTDQRGARVFTTSPMHLARFNTTYRFGDWTLGGGISWQSAVYQNQAIPTGRFTAAGVPITRSGRVTQGGYLLVDLMGRYRINEQLSVGVTVTNLFDKVYYRNVGFFNSGYWGEPRRLLFNLRANF
ncbi:TonB-dependent siderophore receptor [Xanthomonas campestris pv. raphani]|uniref:TonB-dependent siderophore receptor n=1 Tax=Xanthomonas campestris TaxID=339 RepID=UPI002B22C7A6|nr:TonB-dependent siderophore receptor [Xanthomonas campestris]MEA9949635.1 TonB-dependent siderophore receptor [Xanthomonas campestris pv. raphani]